MFEKSVLNEMFKAYDVRGVEPDLNRDFAYAFGRAFVKIIGVTQVAVGHDMRRNSKELRDGLIDGLRDEGADVVYLGQVPTDLMYFATGSRQYEAGIIITASHNPAEWNGFKAVKKNAEAIGIDTGLSEIRDLMSENHEWGASVERGDYGEIDLMDEWVAHVMSFINVNNIKPMKLVIDAGNGMTGEVATRVCAQMPQIEMIPMYFDPDGNFPNHEANPIKEENLVDLKGKMEQEEAELGVAFDADGDRVVFVDDEYETLSGSLTTALLGEMLLKKNPGEPILYTATVSRLVPDLVKRNGGTSIRTRVGHSFIKQQMKKHNGLFGGEHSGHYFFRDNWYADSGMIAFVHMLEYISMLERKLSEVRKEYETYFSPGEINFKVQDRDVVLEAIKQKYQEFDIDTLDGVTIDGGEDWWFNVRPSNTEPLVRLTLETTSKELMDEKFAELKEFIESLESE